jgi:hypothetical protein
MSNTLIALAIGFVFVLVVLPILVAIILAALDALFRVDIGFSKLVWLGLILLVPVGGMLLYWLFRPNDYNPLLEEGPMEPSIIPGVGVEALPAYPQPNVQTLQDGRRAAVEAREVTAADTASDSSNSERAA